MGVPVAQRLDRHSAGLSRHEILHRFWDRYSQPSNIDCGEHIRTLSHPKVFRIRTDNERAATWYDANSGVVWLLRILALSQFPTEPALYNHFRFLEQRGQLMPSDQEIALARGMHLLESMVGAISEQFNHAHADPSRWHDVAITAASGETMALGHLYVSVDEELVSRYLVLRNAGDPPDGTILPTGWRQWLIANCFPTDEPVTFAYARLPLGMTSGNRDIVLCQDRLAV
jgi:hypothetical protein